MIYCGLDSPKPMRIIGVVGNIRQYGPARPPSPQIYMAYQQHPQPATGLSVLVLTASSHPRSLARCVSPCANFPLTSR